MNCESRRLDVAGKLPLSSPEDLVFISVTEDSLADEAGLESDVMLSRGSVSISRGIVLSMPGSQWPPRTQYRRFVQRLP